MARETIWLLAILVVLGASWGITGPLTKIAVSTGYLPFGLVFWQLVIGAVLLIGLQIARGRPLRLRRGQLVFCLVIALIGTVLPNTASYQAYRFLPAGIVAILLSLVPMFAFPVALILGTDRFSLARLAGLGCGLVGVLLIAAPEASLPDAAMVVFLPLALIAPVFYACEGNIVARWGTYGLDPIEVLLGASVVGALVAAPMAVASGQFFWLPLVPGPADWALIASSTVHVVVYTGYVWLVQRAGAVFAAQVSYLVTGFGVLWSMLILGESYSLWVWAAMAVMFLGLFLVTPRQRSPIETEPAVGQ